MAEENKNGAAPAKELTKEIRLKCKEYSKHGCKLSYFHEGFG